MSHVHYDLLPSAQEDLTNQLRYLMENASNDSARKLARSITTTAGMLATMPGMGIPCRFTHPEFRTLRRFPVKEFRRLLIFYRASPNGIEIVRLLGARTNWPSMFLS